MSSAPTPDVPTGNTFDKYATTNPIEQRMMRGFMTTLDRFVDGIAPTRVLEVGIGEGIVTQRLKERFPTVPIIGIDLPDDALAEHWREDDIGSAFADVMRLPFPDDAFDLVLAIEVFEHFDDPETALREVARVCSGSLIASVPLEPVWRIGNMARGRYIKDLGNTPGHVNHWGRRAFTKFVAREFTVDDVATPLPWTMLSARPTA
ncbi:class I SAM-dependent methyltransferase [Ilumatobacter sp.]|uniref:class I SAM-dependent methyltransferase n=1 Tax=Ilumatobacter sp. TaxID=1967498 RepID=UPI003C6179A3